MGTKEVIDYVMDSPGNTNRAVLKGLLGDIAGGGSGGVFLVTATHDNDRGATILDHTYQEIWDAMASGLQVLLKNENTFGTSLSICGNIHFYGSSGSVDFYNAGGYSVTSPDDYPYMSD